jgi:hypothetical protein
MICFDVCLFLLFIEGFDAPSTPSLAFEIVDTGLNKEASISSPELEPPTVTLTLSAGLGGASDSSSKRRALPGGEPRIEPTSLNNP